MSTKLRLLQRIDTLRIPLMKGTHKNCEKICHMAERNHVLNILREFVLNEM